MWSFSISVSISISMSRHVYREKWREMESERERGRGTHKAHEGRLVEEMELKPFPSSLLGRFFVRFSV